MPGVKLEQWEAKLRKAFDHIDDYLEDKYEGRYLLHPARPRRGRTSNKKYDGLFSVGAAYSAGFGSELGEGYVLEIRMVTLSKVPADLREQIEQEVVGLLQVELDVVFPNRELDVERDGNVYKIVGDLTL